MQGNAFFKPVSAFSSSVTRQLFLWVFLLPGLSGLASAVQAQFIVPDVVYADGDTALIQIDLYCDTDECHVEEKTETGHTRIQTVSQGQRSVGVTRGPGTYSFYLQRCTMNANGSTAHCSQEALQTVEVKRLPGIPVVTAPAEDADGSYSVKVGEVAEANEYQTSIRVNDGNWQDPVSSASAPTLNEVRPTVANETPTAAKRRAGVES